MERVEAGLKRGALSIWRSPDGVQQPRRRAVGKGRGRGVVENAAALLGVLLVRALVRAQHREVLRRTGGLGRLHGEEAIGHAGVCHLAR